MGSEESEWFRSTMRLLDWMVDSQPTPGNWFTKAAVMVLTNSRRAIEVHHTHMLKRQQSAAHKLSL